MFTESQHNASRTTRPPGVRSAQAIRLALLLVLLAALLPTTPAQAQAERPNLLFLFADDLAPDAIGALGNPVVKTPVLDGLAARSTSFSNAYNQGAWTGAVCRSSRDMLESGQFLWNALNGAAAQINADGGATELFNSAGYDTYFAGKHHLSADVSQMGFDRIGTVRPAMPADYQANGSNAAGYYARPAANGADTWDSTDTSPGGFWEPGETPQSPTVHWSETLADEGIGFLEEAAAAQADNPFYMQLSFNSPHDPRQAPADYLNLYSLDDIEIPANFPDSGTYAYAEALGLDSSLRDENLAPFPRTELAIKTHIREYYAAVSYMDAQIGRVLNKLAALESDGALDNTYVILAGDHGLAMGQHGLMGKQNMFEHSVRTPLLISGPDIASGETNEARVYYQDVMPTMLELAGVQVPSTWQFRSLLPLLRGERSANYPAIYGAYADGADRPEQRMVIQDDHKLILYPELSPPVALLYDLVNDPDEMIDLINDPSYEQRRQDLLRTLRNQQVMAGDTLDLRAPFPTADSIRVEAESYSAATDTDQQNLGQAPEFPAPADVWPHANGPAGQRDGHVVGRTRGGETLTYADVQLEAGVWRIDASWATAFANPGGMSLFVDDTEVGSFRASTGSSWWVFQDSTFGEASVGSGPHTLRVAFTGEGQINFDYLQLTRIGDVPTERVEAEAYDSATDTDPENLGQAPQFDPPADVWPHASGPAGQRDGFVVGRTRGGETLTYENVQLGEGLWRMSASWASGFADPGGMALTVDGNPVGSFQASAGHWWVFEDSTFGDVALSSGPHTLVVEFTGNGQINFDYLEVTRIGDLPPWSVDCAGIPSWVRLGDSFTATAAIDPPERLADLAITWTFDGVTPVGRVGQATSPPLTPQSASAGRARAMRITASDGDVVRSVECDGVVVVEPDAVVVEVGQDLQDAIAAAGPNATVYLDRGDHTDQVNTRPSDGQTIAGFVDTDGSLLSTLDGTGTEATPERRQAAFISNPGENHPQGVTIRDLEFTNWTTYRGVDGSLERSGFHGVIHIQSATTTPRDRDNCTAVPRDPTGWGPPIDWTIRGVDIHDNDGAGILVSSGVTLVDSSIRDNAHIGIGGTFVRDALIQRVSVQRNALHPDVVPNNHAGGLKITRARGVQILSSEFTGNGGPGIWLDIDTWGNRVIDNVASNNTTFGIFQEISWASEIRDNTALDNGRDDILVAESGGYADAANTTITLNVVENNRLSDAEVATRAIDRSCDYAIFRAADDTILPSAAITGYAVQHNDFYNNGPNGVGADPLVEPGPWVPRTIPIDGQPEPAVPGASGPIHAMVTTTCLAENGRVDINIVNTGAGTATYRIEFGALSPRQRSVAAGDWWRMPITGRADGTHDLVITRSGSVILDQVVTVTCDTSPPVVRSPEVQVVNACRAGNGYLIFQFANPSSAGRSWIIEFEGLPNRSTSAAAYGGSVRGVTGRPNGIYEVTVRSASDTRTFDVTVTC